jgi:hypothetical protein
MVQAVESSVQTLVPPQKKNSLSMFILFFVVLGTRLNMFSFFSFDGNYI